ncbi:MAG: radical SAM family heme chaperone HemW [Bacteroidetes bacterium]|nr:MAG: radical SAM family heme chaperone HemW [Bacteroidota bacterium]
MKTDLLYIHIPFCIRKCIYCDFFSVSYDESVAKTYIDALCQELYLKKDFSTTLKSIYIGGGTPSLLPNDCFRQLFNCLRNNFNFSSSAEITVEANPGTINESKINTALSLGVNRLSIGIQSFNNDELKTLGRIHSSEDASRSIEIIKKEGINNFSVDLMYGIPGQTMDSWHNSISTAVGLSPTHISAYELTPEENTPLYKLIKSHKINMSDEELILEMYNHAIDYFASCGYEHYEISNFALPGFKCMHNLNYWDRGEYIGVGAGAHSFVNGIRSNNTKDITGYIEDLNNRIISDIESAKPTSVEALKEFIFLGLRKTEGININELPPFIPPLTRGYNSLLDASKELIDEGYLEINRGYLALTRKGIVISNTIIVRLFERLRLD